MRVSRYVFIGLASILSLSLFTQGVFAVSTGTSNATVNFVEDTDPTPILDPDDPTLPPGDPGINPGPLSLDYVSNLEFGQQKVSLKDVTYNAKTLKPFIQVTDKRSNPDGWDVTVKATPFTSTDNVYQLAGATIYFKNGEAKSDLGERYIKPTTTSEIKLDTNNAPVQVAFAVPNEGRGSWIIRWFPSSAGATTNDNVKLFVPGGIMKAVDYTSTLTWTLTTAP